MATDRPLTYVPALDGVRALAVLLVVGFHAKVPGFSGGYLGVDIFFVLSGYLITRLLLQEHESTGTIALRAFYVRRLRRLYPALLLFLAIYLVLAATLLTMPPYPYALHVRDAVLSAAYLHDYTKTFDVYPLWLRHMWSLSIEEHFYLLWPLGIFAIAALRRRQAIIGLIALYVLATAWRILIATTSADHWEIYTRFDTHATGLIAGCLLGYWQPRRHPIAAVIGLLGLVACIVAFPHKAFHSAIAGFTLAEFSAALVVSAPPAFLGGQLLTWIGRLSYGLYLWHYLIARMVRELYWGWPETLAASLAGGLACAAASYYLVETRFHRRKLRIDPAPEARDAVFADGALEPALAPACVNTTGQAGK